MTMNVEAKQFSPAAQRNREPIADVLCQLLAADARVLEVASGSGEHAVHMAQRRASMSWQPTDREQSALDSIAAWRRELGVEEVVQAPLRLDVTEEHSSAALDVGAFDAVFCANMIHIAPWEASVGLFSLAGRQLTAEGLLILYGPFREGGTHTAKSNAEFEQWLLAKDSRFGVRDRERVEAVARAEKLELSCRIEMPANNLILVFSRSPV